MVRLVTPMLTTPLIYLNYSHLAYQPPSSSHHPPTNAPLLTPQVESAVSQMLEALKAAIQRFVTSEVQPNEVSLREGSKVWVKYAPMALLQESSATTMMMVEMMRRRRIIMVVVVVVVVVVMMMMMMKMKMMMVMMMMMTIMMKQKKMMVMMKKVL